MTQSNSNSLVVVLEDGKEMAKFEPSWGTMTFVRNVCNDDWRMRGFPVKSEPHEDGVIREIRVWSEYGILVGNWAPVRKVYEYVEDVLYQDRSEQVFGKQSDERSQL